MFIFFFFVIKQIIGLKNFLLFLNYPERYLCLEVCQLSVYILCCLWNVLSIKCSVYKMLRLWNVLFLKIPVAMICPIYQMPCLRNVLYVMSCLWNILSMFVKFPVYKISRLWNYQLNALFLKCLVSNMSCIWNTLSLWNFFP